MAFLAALRKSLAQFSIAENSNFHMMSSILITESRLSVHKNYIAI